MDKLCALCYTGNTELLGADTMDRIAVLIPCYNEAQTIGKVVRDFQAALPADSAIYVYDNNSTDGTAEIARAAGAIVRREAHQGKGNVVRRMFREIDAECYLMVDGDNTYPPERDRTDSSGAGWRRGHGRRRPVVLHLLRRK